MLSVSWIYGTKDCRQNGALLGQNGPLKDSIAYNVGSLFVLQRCLQKG